MTGTPAPESAHDCLHAGALLETEGTSLRVVGPWGDDGARDLDEARANVAEHARQYPERAAEVSIQIRTYRYYSDGSECHGPWKEIA